MPVGPPGHAEPSFANAALNFCSALRRQKVETGDADASAFDQQLILPEIFLPAAFCLPAAHFCCGVPPARTATGAATSNVTAAKATRREFRMEAPPLCRIAPRIIV